MMHSHSSTYYTQYTRFDVHRKANYDILLKVMEADHIYRVFIRVKLNYKIYFVG